MWGLVATVSVSALIGATLPPWSAQSAPDGPITITAGGTYSGNWKSTDSSPAVTIATSQPVTISNSVVTNLAGGTLVQSLVGGAQVTLDHVRGYGGASYATSGRFFIGAGYTSVTIRNSTIENTKGIQLDEGTASSTVLITRNKHRNIQGGVYNLGQAVGNFVQFRDVQNAAIEVSWNEVVNEHGRSAPTDLVSIYQTANVRLHDNYFHHQSEPENTNVYSQNGITIDPGDHPTWCHDNEIWNNQVIDGAGIGIFGGNNNFVHHNRIIQDGFLPGGITRINPGYYEPVWIAPGYTNNHMHGNVIGYINHHGKYMHGRYAGATEGDLGERAKNRYLPRRVMRIAERTERRIWLRKVAANRIRVGAA